MKRDLVVWVLNAAVCLGSSQSGVAAGEADAKAEYDQVMVLTPNPQHGKQVYLICAVCHRPEGWGTEDGSYPQIAGQWPSVIIKQLTDIRARTRESPTMYPFAVQRILGGPQEIADVAAYVAALPMAPHYGQGPGNDLAYGERLYLEQCRACHGYQAQGDETRRIPALWGQHYQYLVRELEKIKLGKRHNAAPEMQERIRAFTDRDLHAVADYVSRLAPPKSKLANSPDWTNPDFPNSVHPLPSATPLSGDR